MGSLSNGYLQDFDSLGLATISSSAIAASGGNLGAINPGLAGAFLTRAGGSATTASLAVTADQGTMGTGGYYNYSDTATNPDRALGGIYSSSFGSPIVGFRLRNDTGRTISSNVSYSFVLEQYYAGEYSRGSVSVSITLIDSKTSDASFVASLASGDVFYYPAMRTDLPINFGAERAFNGNLSSNQTSVGGGIHFDPGIAPGQDIAFRFVGNAPTMGTGYGFGVDNFRVYPLNPVPEPASMAVMTLGLGVLAARRRKKSA